MASYEEFKHGSKHKHVKGSNKELSQIASKGKENSARHVVHETLDEDKELSTDYPRINQAQFQHHHVQSGPIQYGGGRKIDSRHQQSLQQVSDEAKGKYSKVMAEFQSKHAVASPQHLPHKEVGTLLKSGETAEVVVDVEKKPRFVDASTQYNHDDLMAETHYILGAFSFICCPVLSYLSVKASRKVSQYIRDGKHDLAQGYSTQALCLGITAVILGMTIYIILGYLMLSFVGASWWAWDE